jgi:sugar lactone lactonase YvrE
LRVARIEFFMQAPCQMPNGLQATKDGLWIVDQLTDDAILVDRRGKVLRRFFTESENASGVTFGGGALWIGVNGTTQFRVHRKTDRHDTGLLKVDPRTGKTLAWYKMSGEGRDGIHGVEWVRGRIWVTRPGVKTIEIVDAKDGGVQRVVNVALGRSHGMAWQEGHMWCVFTTDRVICKLDPRTGKAVQTIEAPKPHPEPHGFTIWDGDMLYCDATTGAICRVVL